MRALQKAKEEPASSIIQAAERIDLAAWLLRTLATHTYGGVPHGAWPPEAEPNHHFSIVDYSFHKEPLPPLYIGLIPTDKSWQVPAFLHFGGLNNCPTAEIHIKLLRYWYDHCGTEVVGITPGRMDLLITQPIRERADAFALAEMMWVYWVAFVNDDTGVVEELAAWLIGSTAWYFWWD